MVELPLLVNDVVMVDVIAIITIGLMFLGINTIAGIITIDIITSILRFARSTAHYFGR